MVDGSYSISQNLAAKNHLPEGGCILGVVQFVRSIILFAILLGAAGTLVEATGCVGQEAVKAHQHGGMSFRWLNQQLLLKAH